MKDVEIKIALKESEWILLVNAIESEIVRTRLSLETKESLYPHTDKIRLCSLESLFRKVAPNVERTIIMSVALKDMQ